MIELKGVFAGYFGEAKIHDIHLAFHQGKIQRNRGTERLRQTNAVKNSGTLLTPKEGSVYLGEIDICANELEGVCATRCAVAAQIRMSVNMRVENLVMHGVFLCVDLGRKPSQEDKMRWKSFALDKIESLRNKIFQSFPAGKNNERYIAMAIAQDTEVFFIG